MALLVHVLSLLLLSLLLRPLSCSAREYQVKEQVPVEVNTVGPFNNPAETYRYYSLPFCYPKGDTAANSGNDNLGETLAGDRRRASLYDIRFGIDEIWHSICHFVLSPDDVKLFRQAIEKNYIFEFFVDDLPVKGFVGKKETIEEKIGRSHIHEETHYYLYTHLDFVIARNGPHLIAVNLTTDPTQRVELDYEKESIVDFSYSVKWVDTDVSYFDRAFLHSRVIAGSVGMEETLEIHWLSIINSFVLVILLVGFLGLILVRILRKDFARYMEIDEEDEEDEEEGHPDETGALKGERKKTSDELADESGWKLIHGDVFRFPPYPMVLSAALGNGVQLLVLAISLLLLALLGTFYPGNRGAIYTAGLVLYTMSTFISGYVSTNFFLRLDGKKWASNALFTAFLFFLPFFLTFSCLNTIAWHYGSSSALPASVIALCVFIWVLLAFPLTILGAMKARSKLGPFPSYEAPCKTNKIPREIPPTNWYRHSFFHYLIAGFLPFSAIYIELHYIFTAVWGHRVYTLFGILTLAFIMLLLVTTFISVALTYFQLAAEDYRWWWKSFFSGASVGIFVYLYALFFYHYRSEMYGFLQSSFFFGYILMVSYAFSLMLGSISFTMAQGFVRHIYKSIKVD